MRTEDDLRAALEQMAAQAPAGHRVLTGSDGHRRVRTRRRRFGAVLVAAAVVLVALACAWAVLTPDRVDRPSAPLPTSVQRPAPTWRMTHRVSPPKGWKVTSEVVYRDNEQILLGPTGSGDASCQVGVDRSGGDPGLPADARPLTLAGRSGVYAAETEDQDATFAWRDDSGAWADVTCAKTADPEALIARVVPGLTEDPHDLRVPFTLAALPAGLEVRTVYHGDGSAAQNVDLGETDEPDRPGVIGVYLWNEDPLHPEFDEPGVRVRVAGRPAVYAAATERLCLPGRPTVCVSEDDPGSDPPASGAPIDARLQAVFAAVRPVDDLPDENTWPTATQALP